MWCRQCNMETTKEKCPVCGTQTIEDTPVVIYWCSHCRIPIVQEENQADKGYCPVCKKKTRYMSTDLRPVFPEERLLLEILFNKKPNGLTTAGISSRENLCFFPCPSSRKLILIPSARN